MLGRSARLVGMRMASPPIQTRRWSRTEYDRMLELGVISPGERVQLIDGDILTITPQNSFHAAIIGKIERALRHLFGDTAWVRVQIPLVVDPDSEPEPDLAGVSGSPEQYLHERPRTALLVVEVADTTLSRDRGRQASLYAKAGIGEYWVVNLATSRVEVSGDSRIPSDALAR